MQGLVDISDFVNFLEKNDMLIVNRLQYKLLQKPSLTIKEVVSGHLLPVKTRQSIKNWIDNGNIHESEVYIDKEGTTRIIIEAIKRIRTKTNMT